jgi:GNAT superfamily N-acetyltransferase
VYEIGRCSISDIPAVIRLSEKWASEGITHGLAANSFADIEGRMGEYFLVAFHDQEIVGYIFGAVHVSEGLAVIPAEEKYLEIDEVYIQPEHRRSGIGHQLVDSILAEAKSNGVSKAIVYSATKQWQDMVRFYEKHDFKMWFVQMYRST